MPRKQKQQQQVQQARSLSSVFSQSQTDEVLQTQTHRVIEQGTDGRKITRETETAVKRSLVSTTSVESKVTEIHNLVSSSYHEQLVRKYNKKKSFQDVRKLVQTRLASPNMCVSS